MRQPGNCQIVPSVEVGHEIYTGAVRHVTIAITAALAILIAPVLRAQNRMTPTAPGTSGDPNWQAVVKMTDGRTFLTDGGLAIDTAIAKPAKLPEREVSGKVLETYIAAPHTDEYSLGDLTAAASGKTYLTPKGTPLNATYVSYLRRVLPRTGTRLRVGGDAQPVVVVSSGKVVGVLMPVAK